jgi:hypothetical protein
VLTEKLSTALFDKVAAARLSEESDDYLNWQKNRSGVREKSSKGQYLRLSQKSMWLLI